ncbi:MAG TPA: TonB-dependent receptor [Steroidobacteraceae bacterium]|nr:TonB-dependent receptor [Steroidobacteraceae bacterium]
MSAAVAAALSSVLVSAQAQDSGQSDIGRVTTGSQGEAELPPVKPSATRDRAAALEEKKEAPNLIEVQPLAEMQKLPDVNLAEALQRIPGISLETDTGEGRFVNIRGLDSDLNGTTYDGVRLPPSNPASPFKGGRATAFDVIPTGLIGGVELTKTNRPDLDAEALGGTINLVPRRGDAEGGKPFTEVTLGGGYENLRRTPVYDAAITGGRSFSRDGNGLFGGPNAFSALITAVYHQDGRGLDDVEESYSDNQSSGVPDKVLSSIDFRRYVHQRETYGFAGNFDAKADELNSFYLRLMWTGYLEFKQDHDLVLGNLDATCNPSNTGATPTGCNADPSVYPNGFTAPQASFDLNQSDMSERIDNQLAILGGKSIVGAVELDYRVSIAQGRDQVNYSYGSDWSFNGANGNSVSIAYDNNSNPNYPNYKVIDGSGVLNPANYVLTDLSNSVSSDRDREWGGGLDGKLPMDAWGGTGFVKFGANARLRHKTHHEIDPDYQPIAGSPPILLSNYVGGPDELFYHNIYNVMPAVNLLNVRALQNSPSLANVNVNDVELIATPASINDNENVYAEYGEYESKWGRWGLLTGLRVEETHATYRGFEINSGTNTLTGEIIDHASYNNFFPTLQGRYSFSDALIGRATYSTAIARPGFDQVTASTSFSLQPNTVTIGNPALKPTIGNNLDLSLEYYPTSGAIVSAGLFGKWFKNYILPTVYNVANFFPPIQPNTGVVQVTSYSNGPGHAYGAEASIVDHFDFLPAPWSGFGTSSNLTYVDSDAEVHPGVHGLLPSTSRVTWNASLFYERGPVEARLAAGFVGQDLFAFGSTAEFDIYSRKRLTLDWGSSYQLVHAVQIYFDVKNLLNTPLEFTEGSTDARPIQREFYDFTFLAGVRAHF